MITQIYIQKMLDLGIVAVPGQDQVLNEYAFRSEPAYIEGLLFVLTKTSWKQGLCRSANIGVGMYKSWLDYWLRVVKPLAFSKKVPSDSILQFMICKMEEVAVVHNECSGCDRDVDFTKEVPRQLAAILCDALSVEDQKKFHVNCVQFYYKTWATRLEKYMVMSASGEWPADVYVEANKTMAIWDEILELLSKMGRDRASVDFYRTEFEKLDSDKKIIRMVHKCSITNSLEGSLSLFKKKDATIKAVRSFVDDVLGLRRRQRKIINGTQATSINSALELFLRVSNNWVDCRGMMPEKAELDSFLISTNAFTRVLAKTLHATRREREENVPQVSRTEIGDSSPGMAGRGVLNESEGRPKGPGESSEGSDSREMVSI